jgi:hypothetical protein
MNLDEHRKLGVYYFNSTWDLIEKLDRNKDEDERMIHYAHASRLHWELSGAPILNLVRGDWQISRVYSLLGLGESALYHAQSCYTKTINNKIGDFDLVFAYECMANAYKVLGNEELMKENLELGYKSIDQVKKDTNKEYCKSELDNI